MSDPKRWRDPGADAPSHLRELVAHAPRTRAMTAADRVRAAASVGRLAAVKPVASLATGLWVKAAAIAVSVGLASTLAVVARRPGPPPAAPAHASNAARAAPRSNGSTAVRISPIVAVPENAVVPPVLPVPAAVALPVPALAAASPVVAPRPSAARSVAHARGGLAPVVVVVASRASAVADAPDGATAATALGAVDPATTASGASRAADTEFDRLNHARALVARDPADALREIDAEDALYPGSQWAEARAEVRVRALIALGRLDEARAYGSALIAAHPLSRGARLVRHELARLAAP